VATFILSFLGGYIIGKGMIVFKPKLTEEEKKEQEEMREQFKEMAKKYNEAIDSLTGFGDY